MKKGQEWTEEQLSYLIQHYPCERAEDIATKINKSKIAVQKKAYKLKIGKDREGFHAIRSIATSGKNSGNFKNYRRRTTKGYIEIHKPEHPFADKKGNVMEHRLVMEKAIGCVLPKNVAVHHINGIKDDNRIENLAVMTHKAHSILHNKRDGKQKSGKDNPLYKQIDLCYAKELRDKGFTVKEICEQLKCSKSNYYKKLRGA